METKFRKLKNTLLFLLSIPLGMVDTFYWMGVWPRNESGQYFILIASFIYFVIWPARWAWKAKVLGAFCGLLILLAGSWAQDEEKFVEYLRQIRDTVIAQIS